MRLGCPSPKRAVPAERTPRRRPRRSDARRRRASAPRPRRPPSNSSRRRTPRPTRSRFAPRRARRRLAPRAKVGWRLATSPAPRVPARETSPQASRKEKETDGEDLAKGAAAPRPQVQDARVPPVPAMRQAPRLFPQVRPLPDLPARCRASRLRAGYDQVELVTEMTPTMTSHTWMTRILRRQGYIDRTSTPLNSSHTVISYA